MQLHELQRDTRQRGKIRVGRGVTRGKTSGRGHKGQKARAGSAPRPQHRDVIKQIPKRRGFSFQPVVPKPTPVNLTTIANYFAAGETVSPHSLVSKGVIEQSGGRLPTVKVLGDGAVSVAVTVSGCRVSAAARSKIEQAGGSINE